MVEAGGAEKEATGEVTMVVEAEEAKEAAGGEGAPEGAAAEEEGAEAAAAAAAAAAGRRRGSRVAADDAAVGEKNLLPRTIAAPFPRTPPPPYRLPLHQQRQQQGIVTMPATTSTKRIHGMPLGEKEEGETLVGKPVVIDSRQTSRPPRRKHAIMAVTSGSTELRSRRHPRLRKCTGKPVGRRQPQAEARCRVM